MSASVQTVDVLGAEALRAARRATEAVLARRDESGYWCAELTADSTLESDYILLELWLDPPQGGEWRPRRRDRIEKAARSILARQLPDGGFSIYPGGPAEVSATVKAYFALKLSGLEADDPRLAAARERILQLGGVQAANSYVKINLSLFGLYPAEHCPTAPVEMMLMPGDFIYQMSSWTRAIVIPLAIVQAISERRPAPRGFSLDELFLPGASLEHPSEDGFLSWRTFFLAGDRLFKLWRRYGLRTVRRIAVRKAERWVLERMRDSDGLGAIYPAMHYAVMALEALGYPPEHPDRREAERQFFDLLVDDGERLFFQPCHSAVWDTAIAAFAVVEAGALPELKLRRTADWLLSKEVRRKGDWAVKRPNLEPSGWYFEFANEHYPDIDDTAMVLLALRRLRASDPKRQEAAVRRAIRWLLAMQSKDGGWAAFDVDNDWRMLASLPFADHNAMLDPTCPDITGRVMEALCEYGLTGRDPAIRQAVEYLVRTQKLDGSWSGRWGVNHLYGTFLALRGLRAAGEGADEAHVLRGGEWLRSVQNPDGGWGESCESYDADAFVPAPSTPSQTAWALMGLLAGGDTSSDSVHQGFEYLISTQQADGTWEEEAATGTGFPGVFYLTYYLYRDVFPLMALGYYERVRNMNRRDAA